MTREQEILGRAAWEAYVAAYVTHGTALLPWDKLPPRMQLAFTAAAEAARNADLRDPDRPRQ